MNNSNYIFNGLPHYDVFKQKVSKQIELSNSYSTKIMGHKGSKTLIPLSQMQLILSKANF